MTAVQDPVSGGAEGPDEGGSRSSARNVPPASDKRTAAGRVLDFLGAFSHNGGSLTLTEISRNAALSLSTTHRIAQELLGWGGLELDTSGHYRLSHKILELASSSTEALWLRERALPHLVDLHRATALTVHLTMRDGSDVMHLEALREHPNFSGASRIGGRLPMHVTATGMVMLANAGEEFMETYLAGRLQRYTPHTITDPDILRAELEKVRRDRFAISWQFLFTGMAMVAAPVVEPDESVQVAVGAVCRLDHCDPAKLVDPVRITAERISSAIAENDIPPDPRTVDFNRRQAGLF